MKKFLALMAAALVLTVPAMADDDRDGDQGRKGSQHWLPGGLPWQPADAYRGRGPDRDGDGDHDRWDHRRDWDRHEGRGRDRSAWGYNSGWGYRGQIEDTRAILGRWALINFDFNRDGRLDRREYEQSQYAFYDLADRNGDGIISEWDWRAFMDRYAYRKDIGYRYGYQPRNTRW